MSSFAHKVYLSIGSNMGDKAANIQRSLTLLTENKCRVLSLSSVYESQPWGFDSDNIFFNICAEAETFLDPFDFLHLLKDIEDEMGRVKVGEGYSDRIIDLDILFYDELVLETSELQIPHKFMTERLFVLHPLTEIAGEVVHPVLEKTVSELLEIIS